jgi:hypothetical protein
MLYTQTPQEYELTRRHERLLRKLTIDEDRPGTILHDFDAFLTFILERHMSVTPMHQLRRRLLPEINARLARPIQMGLQRPLQKSYPHLHGLYLLLRASGLTRVAGTAKKPLLVVDAAVYQVWQGLNPTERYGTLLETWLLRGHPEIIGERERGWFRVPDTFKESSWFFQRIPDAGLPVAGDEEVADALRYWPGWHNLGLLELFGLIAIQAGPPGPGQGWRIEHIDRTPFGDALLALLHARFFSDVHNIRALESKDAVPFGVLQPTLQPYLPQWQTNLAIPAWVFREGAHVFKVTLWQGLWRRIAIPPGATLDKLASAILNAVGFDHDHLHKFSYRDRFGITQRINHPYLDEGPWTSQVRVGDTPLTIGQTMTFLYDFGDQWEFEVALERVDPDLALHKPQLLEAQGASPEQYGWH